jgi:hypothetical protein
MRPPAFVGLLCGVVLVGGGVAVACSSKDDHPAPSGSSSGASGTSGTSGTSSSGTSGVPANLPATREGGCSLDLRAHGAVTVATSTAAASVCTADGRTKLGFRQDEVASGLVTKRVTVDVVLAQGLSLAKIPITELTVTVQEGELAADGGADAGTQFTKNAVWKMPSGACAMLVAQREYFGTKTSPADYRYSASISCTESAAPASADAQPSALQIDQLTTFTTLQD